MHTVDTIIFRNIEITKNWQVFSAGIKCDSQKERGGVVSFFILFNNLQHFLS